MSQRRERLTKARTDRGLTLKEVENATNGEIKAVTLGSWERGTRMLSVAQLVKLGYFYELGFDEIPAILGDFK